MPPASSNSLRPQVGSPADLAVLVPMLCGFVPQHSLVAVCLRGAAQRVGVTMRVDLPPVEHEPELARVVGARLATDRADGAVLAVYTAEPDPPAGRPRRSLVDAVRAECEARDIAVVEALMVRRGRWTSYLCTDGTCCPPGGTPVAERGERLAGLAAEQVARGRVVLRSRDELAASLAPPPRVAGAARRLDQASDAHVRRVRRDGREAVGRDALRLLLALLDRCAEQRVEVGTDDAALLGIALHDVLVRDAVATWALERAGELLTVLPAVARRVGPPYDAPVSTLVGWVAYSEGNGALANVALDRALGTDPDYAMAQLLRRCLDAQLPPPEILQLLRETRRRLRAGSPWTDLSRGK